MKAFWARRPLFWISLFLAAGIFLAKISGLSWFFDTTPSDDISRRIVQGSDNVFLGGKVVSDVETKRTFYGDRKSSFVLEAKKIWREGAADPEKVRGRVEVYAKDPAVHFRYGDVVVLEGELARPKGLRNPGGFDARAYLARGGIRTVFYSGKGAKAKILSRGKGSPAMSWILKARHVLSRRISSAFGPRDAAFLKALLFGERADLEEGFKDLFIKTGTMHLLAVSGFNIGFVAAIVWAFLRPFRVPRSPTLWAVLLAIWAYSALVGWQAPVVRAAVMATIFIGGALLGRRVDTLNSLGAAAALILVLNPKELWDVGFQLSFLAVFGLVVFMPVFVKKPELLPNEKPDWGQKSRFYLDELFWTSFTALFVTLPVTVENFYIVTPFSILANLVVVPLSFLIFSLGIFFCVFSWAPGAFWFVVLPARFLIRCFVAALFAVEHLPGSSVTVGRLTPVLWAVLAAGIAWFFLDRRIRSRSARASAVFLFSAAVFLGQDVARHFDGKFAMTVLDVGQGDSIYFEFPGGGNLLMDAGHGLATDEGRRAVTPFLKSRGVRSLDALIVSHPQEDHIGGMLTVLDEFDVRHVFDARRPYPSRLYERLKEKIRRERAAYLEAGRGMRIEGFPGVRIRVLNPFLEASPAKNINDDSLVLKISYRDTSFLLTGDIQGTAMKSMLEAGEDVHSDVLKVPHHGAKLDASGRAFVDAVNPKISVISSGERNLFGHPSPETLAALKTIAGNEVFRTDRAGAVEVFSDGSALRAKTTVLD